MNMVLGCLIFRDMRQKFMFGDNTTQGNHQLLHLVENRLLSFVSVRLFNQGDGRVLDLAYSLASDMILLADFFQSFSDRVRGEPEAAHDNVVGSVVKMGSYSLGNLLGFK